MQRRTIVATTIALVMAMGCSQTDDDAGPDIEIEDITAQPDSRGSADGFESEEPSPDPVPDPTPDTPLDEDSATNPDPEPPADDPFAVPDVIDEAYVDLVLDELLRIRSDVERELLARPLGSTLETDDLDIAEAIYAGPELSEHLEIFEELLSSEETRAELLPAEEAGRWRFEVLELGRTSPDCITIFGWPDLTEVTVNPFERGTNGAFVIVRNSDVDPNTNPTGWQIWDNTILLTSDHEPIPQEAWAGLDFGSVLDVDCGGDGA